MLSLYESNGLVIWNQRQITLRNMIKAHFVNEITACLTEINSAWRIIEMESSILTPQKLVNPNYTAHDIFITHSGLVLRPETTMGSYVYAKYLLESHLKIRLPLCVWQSGKSFRQEQDQPLSKVKLKEFYQLEFQCIYSPSTGVDYMTIMPNKIARMIQSIVGNTFLVASDRLPNYSEKTMDIEVNGMEVCSISQRKDFENAKVLEIAIGLDRCVYNWELNNQ